MDKLRPILAQKFWILSAVALIVPPIGWWMAAGNLAAETEKGKTAVENQFKSVPNPQGKPNQQWIKAAELSNEQLKQRVNESHLRLYDRQRQVMEWPDRVIEDKIKNVKYRAEIDDNIRRLYPVRYKGAWDSLVRILEPFELVSGRGKVIVQDLLLPPDPQNAQPNQRMIPQAPWETWRTVPPTSQQMWDTQEDLWLLKSLFEAIARVNKGATDVSNAPIKKINQVLLRGGSAADLTERRAPKAPPPNAPAAPPPSGAVVLNNPALARLRLGFDKGGPGGSLGRGTEPPKFHPDDVFGADGSVPTQVDDRSSKPDRQVQAPTEIQRYFETLPGKWRSRGFVLRLIMTQQQIPALMGELTDSPFPVSVLYVQHSDYSVANEKSDVSAILQSIGAANNDPNVAVTPLDEAKDRINAALNEHYLVDVVICGAMMMYDEPPNAAPAAGQTPVPSSPAAAAANASASAAGSSPPAANGGPQPAGAGSGSPTASANPPLGNGATNNPAPAGSQPGAPPATGAVAAPKNGAPSNSSDAQPDAKAAAQQPPPAAEGSKTPAAPGPAKTSAASPPAAPSVGETKK